MYVQRTSNLETEAKRYQITHLTTPSAKYAQLQTLVKRGCLAQLPITRRQEQHWRNVKSKRARSLCLENSWDPRRRLLQQPHSTVYSFQIALFNRVQMAKKKKNPQADASATVNGNGAGAAVPPTAAAPPPPKSKAKAPEPTTSALIICRNK
ncbi:uncharacterized protein BDZ99DRAFT_220127 [Mytilinidion resinicola]|uniref:Uncharacterized protein n=1 Tax=Mytilinidion resinicola TaxID=574789 RepID=A0A6A6XYI4_9PEZI|nr:uncharacterized protein BDZ99DRAFT_220127 [Mytilinidion resinicola]KAF2801611.1 hypothetical protein BDZ99DRAFT_220127 [Mytilinidion resinicola]